MDKQNIRHPPSERGHNMDKQNIRHPLSERGYNKVDCVIFIPPSTTHRLQTSPSTQDS